MTKYERNKAIYASYQQGQTQRQLGEIFGLSQGAISGIIKAMKNGATPSEVETRGAKPKLSPKQSAKLADFLKQSPSVHDFAVWNKWSIQSLILDKFKVKYHENYIHAIMASIGFSAQKPKKKDYRQDSNKVAEYKEETVPSLLEKASAENRTLVFQDESAVRLLPCIRSTYAPIGQTPELLCDSKNKAFVSISGAISAQGDFYFEVREAEGFKQHGLTRFMDNLWGHMKTPLLMIWDGAPSHRSKTVKTYLEAQSEQLPKIWLGRTPPYSPELNPIEQVWGWLKGKMANQFYKTTKALKQAVVIELNKIKNDKELIQSFFKHEDLDCYQFSI